MTAYTEAHKGEWSVTIHGSHPELGNDDCHSGEDFYTRVKAEAVFRSPWNTFTWEGASGCSEYIMLSGPGVQKIRKNPDFDPATREDSFEEERRERAMEAGMAFGVDAYNEEMGYY